MNVVSGIFSHQNNPRAVGTTFNCVNTRPSSKMLLRYCFQQVNMLKRFGASSKNRKAGRVVQSSAKLTTSDQPETSLEEPASIIQNNKVNAVPQINVAERCGSISLNRVLVRCRVFHVLAQRSSSAGNPKPCYTQKSSPESQKQMVIEKTWKNEFYIFMSRLWFTQNTPSLVNRLLSRAQKNPTMTIWYQSDHC